MTAYDVKILPKRRRMDNDESSAVDAEPASAPVPSPVSSPPALILIPASVSPSVPVATPATLPTTAPTLSVSVPASASVANVSSAAPTLALALSAASASVSNRAPPPAFVPTSVPVTSAIVKPVSALARAFASEPVQTTSSASLLVPVPSASATASVATEAVWRCLLCTFQVPDKNDGSARRRITEHLDSTHNHVRLFYCKVCLFGSERRSVVRMHVDSHHRATHFGHNIGQNARLCQPQRDARTPPTHRKHVLCAGSGLTVTCCSDANADAASGTTVLYSCKLCRLPAFRTDVRSAIDTHVRVVHATKEPAERTFAVESRPSNVVLRCTQCPFLTTRAGAFRRHAASHGTPRHNTQHLAKCRFCDYYAIPSALLQHEVLHVEQYTPRPLEAAAQTPRNTVTIVDITAQHQLSPDAAASNTYSDCLLFRTTDDGDELNEDGIEDEDNLRCPYMASCECQTEDNSCLEGASGERRLLAAEARSRVDRWKQKGSRPLYACELCPYLTRNPRDFAGHTTPHRPQLGRVPCAVCPYWARDPEKLRRHSTVHRPDYYERWLKAYGGPGAREALNPIVERRNASEQLRKDRMRKLAEQAERLSAQTPDAGSSTPAPEAKRRRRAPVRIREDALPAAEASAVESFGSPSSATIAQLPPDCIEISDSPSTVAIPQQAPDTTLEISVSPDGATLAQQQPERRRIESNAEVDGGVGLPSDVDDDDYSVVDRARLKSRLIRTRAYTRDARRLLVQLDDVTSQREQLLDARRDLCDGNSSPESAVRKRCARCPYEARSRVALQAHARHHDAPRFDETLRCVEPDCGYHCADAEALSEHLRDAHRAPTPRPAASAASTSTVAQSQPLECIVLTPASRSRLRAGRKGHSASSCDRSAAATATPTYLQPQPRGNGTREKLMCEKCPFATSFAGRFAKHAAMHDGAAKFLCRYCDYSAPTVVSVKAHEMLHLAPNEHLLSVQPLVRLSEVNPVDAPVFRRALDALRVASRVTARPAPPKEPCAAFCALNIDRLANGAYRCPRCPFNHVNRLTLLRHIIRHAAFAINPSEGNHQATEVDAFANADVGTTDAEADSRPCPFCDYRIASVNDAKQHIALHVGHVLTMSRALAGKCEEDATEGGEVANSVESLLSVVRRRLTRAASASTQRDPPAQLASKLVCNYCDRSEFTDAHAYRSHLRAHQFYVA